MGDLFGIYRRGDAAVTFGFRRLRARALPELCEFGDLLGEGDVDLVEDRLDLVEVEIFELERGPSTMRSPSSP